MYMDMCVINWFCLYFGFEFDQLLRVCKGVLVENC